VLNENDLKWSTTLCKELDEGIDINKELNILAIDQSRLKQLFDQHRLRKAEIQARGKEIVDEQRRVQGTRSTLMDRRTEIKLLLVDAEDTIENGPKQKTPQQSQQYFC
jgi:ribosome-interacting GTPase 1